jgi:hypothetical protein
VQHVLERAGQPVELPDHDRVARAELVEHPVQLGPVPPAARRRLLEDALAAGGPERFCLQQVGLVIPLGDTGIAQEGIVKLNNRSRKSGRRGRCDILIISAHNRHWCLKHKLDKAIQAFSATRSPRRQNQW